MARKYMLYSIIYTLVILDVSAKNCGELSQKIINTYVPSDYTINFLNGTKLEPVYEVSCWVWASIPNAYWIWNTQDYNDMKVDTVVFTKTFYIPGKVISGKIEFLVDNYIIDMKINGMNANYPTNAAYDSISTSFLDTLLVTGSNYFNITVKNEGLDNPGGLCFLITIQSEVLV